MTNIRLQSLHRKFASLAFLCACALLGTSGAAEVHTVSIRDYAFHPSELQINVGDTVIWSNDEKRTSHSIRMVGRDIPESDRFFPGESWQMTFTEAGEYQVGCGPHPEMRAKIVVVAPK